MDVLAIKHALIEFTTLTQARLGAYADLSAARMSRGLISELNGESPFTEAELQQLEETILAIRSVQSDMPLPIDLAQISKVKPHIDLRRKEIREQADPIVRRCILVRISGTEFFLRINSTNVVTTPSEMTAAAFEVPEIADEVVRALRKMGTESRIESFGAFRRASTMSHSLVEVGFEPAAIGGTDESEKAA